MTEGQVILINKPYDWTSFDVVKYVRNAFQGEKVGHAGTLDPLATGLLVLCTGKMTKKITEIQDSEKEYTGSFILGATTPSYDLETEITLVETGCIPSLHDIEETVKKFVGEIEQIPPPHSATKIKGRRAYDMARKGEEVELAAKKVFIKEFEIVKINLPEVFFRIICSKGTYIRSIAHDFGKMLGCGAYLNSLCRTRIGDYRLENAVDPKLFQRHVPEIEEHK